MERCGYDIREWFCPSDTRRGAYGYCSHPGVRRANVRLTKCAECPHYEVRTRRGGEGKRGRGRKRGRDLG